MTTVIGATTALYNRYAIAGVSDTADLYSEAKRLGMVLGGSSVTVDGALIPTTRGTNDATDRVLSGTWTQIAAGTLPADVSDGALWIMGVAEALGSGGLEYGISVDAGTDPVTRFQTTAIPADYAAQAAFGGYHPDPIPAGTDTIYLWARISSGAITLQGAAVDPTRWAFGVQAPDSQLHSHLSTAGKQVRVIDGAGNLVGAMQHTSAPGVALFHSPDGTYSPASGGFSADAATAEVHGTTFTIPSLAGTETRGLHITVKGDVFAVDLPEPGWSLSDSDTLIDTPLSAAWADIGLLVTTTASEPAVEGDSIYFQVIAQASNLLGNITASIAVGIGVDGADPTGAGVPWTIPKGAIATPISSVTLQAPVGGYPTGTVFRAYAQKVGNAGTPIVDATLGAGNSLLVQKQTGGGAASNVDTTCLTGMQGSVSANFYHSGTGEVSLPSGQILKFNTSLDVFGSGTAPEMLYAYAYDNNGTPAIEVNNTPPELYFGSARQKTGDPSRRLLDALPLNGSGNMMDIRRDGNAVYLVANTVDTAVLSAGTSLTVTAVSYAQYAPAWASPKLFFSGGGSGTICNLGPATAPSYIWTDGAQVSATIPSDGSGEFVYHLSQAGIGLSVYVKGFESAR